MALGTTAGVFSSRLRLPRLFGALFLVAICFLPPSSFLCSSRNAYDVVGQDGPAVHAGFGKFGLALASALHSVDDNCTPVATSGQWPSDRFIRPASHFAARRVTLSSILTILRMLLSRLRLSRRFPRSRRALRVAAAQDDLIKASISGDGLPSSMSLLTARRSASVM